MILDRLDGVVPAGYRGLSGNFAVAFDYLLKTDFGTLADTRHEVQGDEVFALVQTNGLKSPDQCRWEGHRVYADIQLVLEGEEEIGRGDLRYFEIDVPYDAKSDVAFFMPARSIKQATAVRHLLTAGEFALFMPGDIHMPLVLPAGTTKGQSRKVVMKVRLG